MLVSLCIVASLAFNAEASLECMACQDSSLCSKITCGSEATDTNSSAENVSRSSTENFLCYTATSRDKIIKNCDSSDICERLKNENYDSCSTCNTSYCNTLKCYQCNNFLNELSSVVIPEKCDDASVDSCKFPDPQCFAAKGLLHGDIINIKGCISKNRIESFGNTLKSYGFGHFFCNKDLCNGKFPASIPSGNLDQVNKQKIVSKPDVAKNQPLSCLNCNPESQKPCHLESCQQFFNDSSPQSYKCLAAVRSQEGKSKTLKTCLKEAKASNRCAVLKKEGYDTCTTCPTSKCNVLSCFYCNDTDNNYNRLFLKPCKVLVEKECDEEPAKCCSVAATLNSEQLQFKDCIPDREIDNLTKLFLSRGSSSYYFCGTSLCNKENSPPIVLGKGASGSVHQLSVILFSVIFICSLVNIVID